MDPASRRQVLSVALLGGVALGASLVVSPAVVVDRLESLTARPMLFALALLGVYLVRPLFLWPVSLVALVLGFLYDPWLAIPISIAGAVVTGLPPFLLARHVPVDGGIVAALRSSGRELAASMGHTRSVVAARLLPVPGDAVSYGAGLSAVSLPAFALGTALGEVPWTLAMVAVGDSMRTLSLEGVRVEPQLVAGLAGLGAILIAGPAYRHWRGRPTGNEQDEHAPQ